MNAREILIEWLTEHGYDGLVMPGECGCGLDDLVCCDEDSGQCEAAYLVPADAEFKQEHGDAEWMYSTEKPKEKP